MVPSSIRPVVVLRAPVRAPVRVPVGASVLGSTRSAFWNALRRCLLLLPAVVALSSSCAPTAPAPLWSLNPTDDNPFPDERLQVQGGAFRVSAAVLRRFLPADADTHETDRLLSGWAADLGAGEGWGVAAPVLVRFDAPLDDLPLDDSALSFVHLDEGDPNPVPARAAWWRDPGVLEVQPLAPLAERSRVALVVTRHLVVGMTLPRPEGFTTAAEGDLRRAASRIGVSPDEIALLVPYRTGAPTAELLAARALVRDLVPAVSFAPDGDPRHGIFSPDHIPAELGDHPRLDGASLVAVGTFTSLDVRDEATGMFDPAVLAGHRPPRSNSLEVILVEPDPEKFPPPWPAVILQHGFGGSNAFVVDNAAPFVARGLAVLGIDASSHGRRGAITSFFQLDQPGIPRDHLRQTSLDHLQLSSLATRGEMDVDGVPGPDLDGSLAYYGHSMGAILGSTFSMLTEDADVVALNAPGGGLCNVFRSVALQNALQYLFRPALGLDLQSGAYNDAFPVVTALVQTLMEGADPIAYARTTARPHLLLQLDVDDRLVPNIATRDLARVAGVPLRATAAADPAGLDALVAHANADYGWSADKNPHNLFEVETVQAQAAEFVSTRGKTLLMPQ